MDSLKTPNWLLKEIHTLYATLDIPEVCILGNHDLTYGASQIDRTFQELLVALGSRLSDGTPRYRRATPREPVLLGTQQECAIFGFSYREGIEALPLIVDVTACPDHATRVILAHAAYTLSPAIYAHRLVRDIVTNGHLVLGSHDHRAKPLTPIKEGQWFVCPGALVRTIMYGDDLNRTPQMVHVQTTGPQDLQVRMIPLKCARPAAEVFRLEEAQAQQALVDQESQFLAQLTSAPVESLSLETLIRTTATEQSLPESIVIDILHRLKMAAAQRAAGGVEVSDE